MAAGGQAGKIEAMTPLVRVCALAGAVSVGGCSGSMPSWDFMPSMPGLSGNNVSLTIESDPPGADAKTSLGPGCRTPCMIPVPADREFSVSYTLNGYLPQTVAVIPRADGAIPDLASGSSAGPTIEVTPNPVYAQLQPAPPAGPNRKRAPKKPATTASKQ
jgi:hypothetical protein